ncbi:ATP-binding protein, partial [Tenacibaculum maritimum]
MVHRDYNSVNGFLQVSIFSDRTKIANYGSLPEGITLKDLRREHNSILRNPDIAKICFIRKYIEMLGSGTLRMINDCKKNKFKTPSWKQKNNITTVVFPELKAILKNDKGVKNELISIYEIIETTPNLKTKD